MKKTSKLSRLFKCFWPIDDTIAYSDKWDAKLNELIDKGNVTHKITYIVEFDGKYEVWLSNHPFSSGTWCGYVGDSIFPLHHRLRCSKATKIRLEDFITNYEQQQAEAQLREAEKKLIEQEEKV